MSNLASGRRTSDGNSPSGSPAKSALWVSTSMSTHGGIASFVRTMRETPLWAEWNVRHVATHRDGSKADRVVAFVVAVPAFVKELICRRPSVVHIHMSSDGSFYRKSLLVWISRTASRACRAARSWV